jgi:hypothetical protein
MADPLETRCRKLARSQGLTVQAGRDPAGQRVFGLALNPDRYTVDQHHGWLTVNPQSGIGLSLDEIARFLGIAVEE